MENKMNQRSFLTLCFVSLAIAALPRLAVAQHPRYTVTFLGALGGKPPEVQPTAINNRGDIVGQAKTASGATHAFLWRNGKMVDLGTLGGKDSFATAINDKGQIVGGSQRATKYAELDRIKYDAFIWQEGKMTALPIPTNYHSIASSINNKGDVCGVMVSGLAPFPSAPHAVLWRNGKIEDIASSEPENIFIRNRDSKMIARMDKRYQEFIREFDQTGIWRSALHINDAGQVVGWSRKIRSDRPFLYENGTLQYIDLPGVSGYDGHATWINNSGLIIGWTNYERGHKLFIRDKDAVTIGEVIGIDDMEGWRGGPYLNNTGDMVGRHGDGGVFIKLGGKRFSMSEVELSGATVAQIDRGNLTGINDHGLIIGSGQAAFLLTPTNSKH
jgi:probable HAF family extracellular repeat protein